MYESQIFKWCKSSDGSFTGISGNPLIGDVVVYMSDDGVWTFTIHSGKKTIQYNNKDAGEDDVLRAIEKYMIKQSKNILLMCGIDVDGIQKSLDYYRTDSEEVRKKLDTMYSGTSNPFSSVFGKL